MMSTAPVRGLLVAACLLAPVACTETGPTTPDPDDPGNGNSPSITLSVSPGSLSLEQGASGEVVVAITRAGGFAGEVALTLENVPSGVTPALTPSMIPVGGSAAAITFAVGGNAAPGTYSIGLRASAQGVDAKSATISLTVVEVTTPGFTLAVGDPTISVAQGTSQSTTVSVARVGGFTGRVDLAVSGMVPGLNATLSPSFIITDPATLAIGATFNGPVGTHTLTITATGQNVPQRTATVAVEITPSNPVGEVAWQYCPASGSPVWFAYQDGMASPWTRVTGVNDIYAFDMVAARGGVAYARATTSGGYRIDVTYGTTDELNTLGQRLCAGSAVGRTVHGTVSGLGVTSQAWVSMGGATAVVPAGTSAFSLQNLLGGPHDLIASSISVGAGGAFSLDRLILRRGLDPANGSSIANLDFNAAESFAPVGQSVTIGNLGSDQTAISMAYHAGGRTTAPYWTDAAPIASATRVFPGIPGSRQAAGDMHLLTVLAAPVGAPTDPFRSATVVFRTASNQNLSLGPTLSPMSVSVPSSAPYARLQATYTAQVEYASYWTFGFTQAGGGGLDRTVIISATGGYFTSFSTISLGLPDFAGTGGWSADYGPRPGVAANWSFTAAGWRDAGGLDGPPILEGALALTASRTGTITP